MSPRQERLALLATLEDGWLDGDGLAIDEAVLTRAQFVSDTLGDLPFGVKAGLFPTAEGGAQFEWSTDEAHFHWGILPEGVDEVYVLPKSRNSEAMELEFLSTDEPAVIMRWLLARADELEI